MPSRRVLGLALVLVLAACAQPPHAGLRLLVFGEQHDQVDQQRQVAQELRRLAAAGRLEALVLEMAERGRSTLGLPATADEGAVREALGWNDSGWPWRQYGPVVMAVVRAGLPVFGGNLPRAEMRAAMLDAGLEARLPQAARDGLSQALREGHCGLLPEAQVPGMLRIQIARDRAMAEVIAQRLDIAPPERLVLLLAGEQHASRDSGVPWHLLSSGRLPAAGLRVVVFGEPVEGGPVADERRAAERSPRPDPCEGLRRQLDKAAPAGG